MPSVPLARVWISAAIVATIGTAVLYQAKPGLNFVIWTAAASVGLLSVRRITGAAARVLILPLGFALLLAAGAAITADGALHGVIVLMVASLLGLATLLAASTPRADEYGPTYILAAPFRALGHTIVGAVHVCVATARVAGATRLNPALRGIVVAVPVVIVFALMFASADPVFARGRDAIAASFMSWELSPRAIFWSLLTLFTVGAYTVVAQGESPYSRRVIPGRRTEAWRIGTTERVTVLGAVAAITWLFVLLQIAYLFGNPAAIVGSGVTFAEYARRGFGELALVATIAILLIVASENLAVPTAQTSRPPRLIRASALALLAAVIGVLISAVHRVALYEAAYGYTTARLYAQAYMAMILLVLVLLGRELMRVFNTAHLARGIMATALATVAILLYWNTDAWIAQRNLDRFATTGKVDIHYLAAGLSPDAYPTLVRALPKLPQPTRAELGQQLTVAGSWRLRGVDEWYEWNLRRHDARDALTRLRLSTFRTGSAYQMYREPPRRPAVQLDGSVTTSGSL